MTKQPIQFSDAAIDHIQRKVAEKSGALGFRLGVKKSGCSGYRFSPEIITTKVLGDLCYPIRPDLSVYLDSAYLEFLSETQVDFIEKGLGQKQMVFNNPTMTGSCGCGESFVIQPPNLKDASEGKSQ